MKHVRITSLVADFFRVDAVIRTEKSPATRHDIWKCEFERPHRDVFRVYYQWADRRATARVFANYAERYSRERLQRFDRYARTHLDTVAAKVSRVIPFSGKLPVVLFVGAKQSNGFVIRYKKQYTTFLNLESYPDIATLRIFMAHELAHAVHLRMGQGYYWRSDRMSWYNTMMLEGVATYITQRALGVNSADALWGHYLTVTQKKRFMRWCESHEQWLKRGLLREIGATARVESAFFGRRKPKGCPYIRTGYWLGLKFVESLLRETSLREVLLLRGVALRGQIRKFLK
ncbi:MAG: hypothetical protein A3B31_00630 [Candidatus Komeilibacteria bacterium RIFCSPLOWO2_01_FULL_53_11]|uniref:DUF2268 domain-containing protein n=1 Tax=Candidatus Komeilibacteria bacterium RIFCSPLOWO2_01_FULL_53_11 TaxID=1798552 RepID=A0A1G2BTQ2_9BACT|nr:MAG: hypothetical protein A3B31_00630 [Candidatus Komeilibacteria bacterium RIFCSPLOWO2_01_FULL_53_11]